MSVWDNTYNRDRVVSAIKCASIPSVRNKYGGDDFWTPQVGRENYLVDMICYHAWRTLCEEFTEVVNDDNEPLCQSKKPDDITELLFYGSTQHYGEGYRYSETVTEEENAESNEGEA